MYLQVKEYQATVNEVICRCKLRAAARINPNYPDVDYVPFDEMEHFTIDRNYDQTFLGACTEPVHPLTLAAMIIIVSKIREQTTPAASGTDAITTASESQQNNSTSSSNQQTNIFDSLYNILCW